MKILSININGLNAFMQGRVFNLGELIDTDVICFQEIKCDPNRAEELISPVFPHKVFSNSSNFKRGYAGVSTLIDETILKNEVKSVTVPDIMGGYGDGRVVTTEFKDFTLVNVYSLNSGNKQELRQEFDELFYQYIKSLGDRVIIVGDLNVVGSELDHFNYRAAKGTMPGLYQFELDNFNKLKADLELVDVYRYLNPTTRRYSWFSYSGNARKLNKGWRIDYTLASKSLVDKVKSVQVLSHLNVSDHCPVMIEI